MGSNTPQQHNYSCFKTLKLVLGKCARFVKNEVVKTDVATGLLIRLTMTAFVRREQHETMSF